MNLLGSVAILLLSFPLAAQADPAVAQPPRARVQAPAVTLAFPGGTLAELVAQIREKEPRANIVVAAAAASAVLPPMELRGAGLDQVLDSACVVATGGQEVRLHGFHGGGEPVFAIVAVAKAPEASRESVRTEVFGLGTLTEELGLHPETLLSAIEAAVGEPRLVALRYHRESGLVIVRGTGEQLEVVQSVLKNVERDLLQRRVGDQSRPSGAPAGADKPKESK
jgi:hypothetical protein